MKLKNWKRRYFVLTDDNCLYYFKSPKDMAAQGLIMLPSYTITKTDRSDNAGKPYSFKAYNRQNAAARKYIFAAEDEREMKTWMNVMSLASIAFGTGKASMQKVVRCCFIGKRAWTPMWIWSLPWILTVPPRPQHPRR